MKIPSDLGFEDRIMLTKKGNILEGILNERHTVNKKLYNRHIEFIRRVADY